MHPTPRLLLLLAAAALCARPATAAAQDSTAAAAAPGPAPAAGSPAAYADLVMRPGDELRINIWREKDLSGDFLVDETGNVTLPLLGRRLVAGSPVSQVRSRLLADYTAQLRNPSIEIIPLRRVNVLGEVQKPGLYPVDPTVSLAGAVAMAGGTTALGDLHHIRVLREGQVLAAKVAYTRSLQDMDIRSGDQIFVERRGWFDRNSTFVVSALLSLTSIVIALVR